MARIFISHSHVDEAEAIALRDWLISQGWGGEDDIFLDLDPKRGLLAGQRWEDALRRNVRKCEAVVFVVTPAWCESKWCFTELQLAKHFNKPVFGIIAKPIEMSNIPIEMTAEWQLVDLTRAGAQEEFDITAISDGKAHEVSFNASELTRLKAGLENTGIDPSYFEWPPESEPNRAPYQGLRAMQSQDAGIFFGRDGQILEGLDRLRGLHDAPPPRMLVILGASGAGKSSYMRAGLLPRLKRDDRHFVVLDSIRPGGNVLSGETGFVAALKHTLEAHDIAASPRRIKQAIGEALDEGSETSSLHDLLHQLASSHVDGPVEIEADENNKSALPSIVIPIDQAEELYFNQDESGASEAKQFRQLLSILARDERLNIILLLTIRSDSYQHMQLDTVLGGVEHQTLSLPPIAQGSYSQIILGPVQRLTMNSDRKLAIEEKLVERLLHDIAQGGAKDALPLLAFTLERLYAEYLEGDMLTLQDYEEMGGIRGSIEAAVEQAFKTADQRGDANIPMEKQARLALLKRGLIPYLASVDPEHNGAVRRVAPLSSIPQEARPIMELLVEQRLLATDTRPELDDKDEPTGKLETTIEPAHEALLRQWGQLGEWLEEDREALSALDGVKRAMIEWDANDKGEAFLAHTAGRLESAEQVANDERFHDYLKQRDRNYLAACRKADNERRNKALEQEKKIFELKQQKKINRRTRLGLIVASVLAIFAGGIGLYAFQQKEIAEKQTQFAKIQEKLAKDLKKQTEVTTKEKERAEEQTQIAEGQKIELEKQKVALAISLKEANVSQSKNLRSSALEAMSKNKYDEARVLMKEAWDKVGGTYDPENPWSDYLAAAQRKLEYNDPLKMTLEGHEHGVNSAQFSPDGKTIATASWDGTARLWDAETGEVLAILLGHQGGVISAQFSPDGMTIITASSDKTARLWDIKTAEEIVKLGGHKSYVTYAQFSPDGKTVLSASIDGTIRLWNPKTGTEVMGHIGNGTEVSSAQFSPDGKTIVTVSTEEIIKIWSTKTKKNIAILEGHTGSVSSAQFSPDGKMIVTASTDKTARIWNTGTGKEIVKFEGHDKPINSASFSPDAKTIVTASRDKTVRLWNVDSGKEIKRFEGHNDSVYSAQFNPDGESIVTTSADKSIRLWAINTTKTILDFSPYDEANYFTKTSFDGKKIITASVDGKARLWDALTGRKIMELYLGNNKYSVQFSQGDQIIATNSVDQSTRVWDSNTGQEIGLFLRGDKSNNFSKINNDGKLILTTAPDNTASLWNSTTGEQIVIFQGHKSWINYTQISPNGKKVLTSSQDGFIKLWDATNGDEIATIKGRGNGVDFMRFNSDGKMFVTLVDDKTAMVWDAITGKEIVTLTGLEKSFTSAQFSPNGKTISTTSFQGPAKLWHIETGEIIASINHNISVSSVDMPVHFSSDGKSILLFGMDYRAIIWDAMTGEEIYAVEHEKSEIPAWASISSEVISDNEQINTFTSSNLVKTWNIPKLEINTLAELNEARQMKPSSIDIEDSFSPNENENSQVAQNLNACDAAGGHPFDTERIGPVLEWETLTEEGFNREELIEACEKELTKQPDEQRLRFQLARALLSTQELENEKRAVDLHLEASENGYAIASYSVAIRYQRGNEEAIKLDPKRSLELYELASSQGMIEANSQIAWAHWNGVGTDQDKPKAISTWHEGAKVGDPFSHKRLAQLYARGELEEENTFIKQDLNMAFYHYAIATQLFEEAGLKESAQKTRYRRASLARTLPQDDVVRIWREVKAWQPEGQ